MTTHSSSTCEPLVTYDAQIERWTIRCALVHGHLLVKSKARRPLGAIRLSLFVMSKTLRYVLTKPFWKMRRTQRSKDGELFREEPGGTYTPIGKIQKYKDV